VVSMTVDQAVRTNTTPFAFQATASDNGNITNYLWDFGDGITTNGAALANVTHAYAADGIFPVTVKVTDNTGESERTGRYVTRDTAGPRVTDITVTRNMLTVRFNQDLQPAGAGTPANYTIDGGITVTSATQTTGNVVRLNVSTLTAGVEYTLTLNNLINLLGVKIVPNSTKTFVYVDGSNLHIRFDFGNTNYPTPGNWNNITNSNYGLVITNAVDIYGVQRSINLNFLPSNSVGYSTGVIASNLYPASAQRDCVYATRPFYYRIEGADPAAQYRLTFFASKSATIRETKYQVGTNSVVLDAAYNSNQTAVIEGVRPDISGNIVFKVSTNMANTGTLCYLSVLELEDTTPPAPRNIEASVGALNIAEGSTSNFLIRLNSQPSGSVTVNVNHVSGEPHVQVLPESAFIYFTTNNWSAWQPVSIEALQDTDTNSGVATIQCADVGGIYVSTNVIVTQLDSWPPPDSDGDGIPDAWMILHFGHATGQASDLSLAGQDADGDGMTNEKEYQAGTNPRDATSYLKIGAVTRAGNDFLIRFPSMIGKKYRVVRCDDLANSGGWTNIVADNVPGTGGDVEFPDPGAAAWPQRFYRVEVLP
jgi:hypothetical protein